MRLVMNLLRLCVLCLVVSACNASSPPAAPGADVGIGPTHSTAADRADAARPAAQPARMTTGAASLSCDYDYSRRTDLPLEFIDEDSLRKGVERCAPHNMLHVYYKGEIGSEFPTLMESLARLAATHSISLRILDIDSPGGDVDKAMKAGDAIADSGWGIWVQEKARCLSACVLLLAAGSNRSITGTVGIHRLFPVTSSANTRAELDTELEAIGGRVRAYLKVHGANPALADLMMTVPASSIRMLTDDETEAFGLAGSNAAQKDLERTQLVRKCGWDFVKRKEALSQSTARKCPSVAESGNPQDKATRFFQCALDLSKQFGFPDPYCPDESPNVNLERLIQASAPGRRE